MQRRVIWIVVLVAGGAGLGQGRSEAHELKEVPASYSLTVHYADGTTKTLRDVESHQLISEKGAAFMSVILKDGRRFLFSVQNRDFEFSHELSHIIAANEAQQQAAEAGKP